MPVSRARAHRSPDRRRRGAVTRLIASAGAGMLAVIGLVAAPSAAIAAANPDVLVTDIRLQIPDGMPAEGPVKLGDKLLLTGSWDATAAEPVAGDTFTMGLPKELGFAESVVFPLAGEDASGAVQNWALCETDPVAGIATCTFTEAVTANPEDVRGEFGVQIEAVLETTENVLEFDLNGRTGTAVLPGGGGIVDPTPLPTDWTKSGTLNADKWSMTWTIEVPGARLAQGDTATIRERLSANHVLCDPSGLTVETVRGSTVVDVSSVGAITDAVEAGDDFAIALTAPEAGFDANVTYRITYRTCTPDGEIDPKGTEYENEAFLWGETSGVIGVGQDWVIGATASKHGSILGGEHRNGVIEWTVTVPGENLFGTDGFTLTDTLSGQHAVTADTVSGIRVFERYGPAGALTEVTNGLTATTVAVDDASFEVRFDIADGSDFAFLPSDHMYLIRYRTTVTTDGLPAAGTKFDNAARIDGELAPGSVTTPNRSQGKSGRINTSRVELNGVEHLPQTTIGWSVRIPGERIATVGTPLTLTDTLTSAHAVCLGDSDDIVDRLGLRLQARDQISGGGLKTVDLTDLVTATLDGDTITLVVAPPTLPLPDDTTATSFSREYEYVFDYTTCTTSGGMDAKGTEYGNTVAGHGIEFSQRVVQQNSGFGTGQGMPRGTVSISKILADTAGAPFVPDGTAFTVHVKEIDPAGTVQHEYDLAVPVNGDPVSGFNSRGRGWTIELSEPRFPEVPGVTWGAPLFQEAPGLTPSADGTTAVAALAPNTNIAVSLVNEAELGAISVIKTLTGPDAARALVDPDQTYRITATVDVSALGGGFPAQPARGLDISAGETVTLNDLPIGATVTFSETRPADSDLLTWAAPVISPQSVVVTADHAGDPAEVTVTNHVERTVGTFSIAKSVTGAEADNPAVPESVTVTATWTQDGIDDRKTLTVPTDGTPVALGENLLIGTKVTLTETPLADGSGIAWGAPVWSGTGVAVDGSSAVVTVGRDANARVDLENHAATSVAGISLIKGLAGAAAGEVDPDTRFPVRATWVDANGSEQSKELLIGTAEPTPLGVELPAGTVVTVTEGERPAFDTVVWGSIAISGEDVADNGDGSAEIVVSDQQGEVTMVAVVNEATWAPGTFTLSKNVTGVLLDNADVPENVTVTASWLEDGEPVSAELTLPTDGTPVPFGRDLPHGTEVVLSETPLDDGAAFTWNQPEWAGDALVAHGDGTAILTVGAATDARAEVTNGVTARLGTLAVSKTLSGDGASLAEGTVFPVTASWTDLLGEPQQVEIEVRAGEPTVIEGLPLGTEVTLAEGSAELPGNVRWLGATWSSNDEQVEIGNAEGETVVITVSGETGAEASIALDNAFEKLPDLATTGGALLPAGVVVVAALLIGAGILLVLRRRRETA
ncbi:DUF5979 domain-containing protein [Microbacterium sp. NPDC058345]|uniref:DUF5979 domain-containing protein n=1 Tax=Microbacterium sp. NPDC058345 TaxID=3346455 RepID=UPI0036476A5D